MSTVKGLGLDFTKVSALFLFNMLNIASSLHHQHVIGAGLSFLLATGVDATLAYNQIIESSNTGPIPGAPPGSIVSVTTGTYSVALGVTVRYGCGSCREN